MFRVTFLAFLVVAALTANECDISLGDLDQFVINYKLQVTNFGNEDAAVSISIQDKMRSATLVPGDKIDVTSFKGGVWHVIVVGSKTRKATLEARYTKVRADLDAAIAGHADAEVRQLDSQLRDLRRALDAVGAGPDAGTCAGHVNDPRGSNLGIAVTNTSSRSASVTWHCIGF